MGFWSICAVFEHFHFMLLFNYTSEGNITFFLHYILLTGIIITRYISRSLYNTNAHLVKCDARSRFDLPSRRWMSAPEHSEASLTWSSAGTEPLLLRGGQICSAHTLPDGAAPAKNKNTLLASQLDELWKSYVWLPSGHRETTFQKWTQFLGFPSMNSRTYPHVQRAGTGDQSPANGWDCWS